MSPFRTASVLAATAACALAIAGCSSSSGSDSSSTPPSSQPSSSAPAAPAAINIVVTNDDGYNSLGIARIATALAALPGVTVDVVAPAENNTGAGGRTTDGPLKITDKKTLEGMPAHAVAGTPADTIRAAVDDLKLTPDLVVSGINKGQNLGPAVDLSGTVGAARAAVARGIPAVAISNGLDEADTYSAAVPFVTEWVTKNQAAIAGGTVPIQVVSINVPSCHKGAVRGLVEVPADLNKDDLNKMMAQPDCTSTAPAGADDVSSFQIGFATQSVLSTKPAA